MAFKCMQKVCTKFEFSFCFSLINFAFDTVHLTEDIYVMFSQIFCTNTISTHRSLLLDHDDFFCVFEIFSTNQRQKHGITASVEP